MLALLVAALGSAGVAYLLLRVIDRSSPPDRLLGESLVMGSVLPAVGLFVFSILSLPWSRGLLVASGIVAASCLTYALRGRTSEDVATEKTKASSGDLALAVPLALLTVALLLGYAKFAFVTAGVENDFIGIWGAKGRAFFEFGGVDWQYLTAPWRGYAHPDYPILVPLMFSSVGVIVGRWSESAIGMVYPMMALGGLVLIRSELRGRTGSSALVWLCVLAGVPFVFSPWIGLADGPLALMILVALLRLARWLDAAVKTDLIVGSIFLGLAMSAKNEGISLGIVAITTTVLFAPRQKRAELMGLWPAALIALPWLVLRIVYGLSTDLFSGGYLSRLFSRVFDWGFLQALGRYLVAFRPGQWLVIAILAVSLVAWRRRLTMGSRFVLVVLGVQIVLYLAAYFVTPLPVDWHVRWSWERLISQVGVSFYVVVVSILVSEIGYLPGSVRGGLATLLRARPEVENQEADPDTDR